MMPNVTTDSNAPDADVQFMFSKLTEENKEKVIRFIADLKEMQ